jgi:hypothetical protein
VLKTDNAVTILWISVRKKGKVNWHTGVMVEINMWEEYGRIHIVKKQGWRKQHKHKLF